MITNDFVHNEPQPKLRTARVYSEHDRFNANARAPSTSAMSTQSACEHGMNTPQPCSEPFVQLVNDGYNGIQNRKIRRKLQREILSAIEKAEDEDFNQNN